INLSGASINNQEFGNFLREQFNRYVIPPHTICFEITETVAITNLENANILITQLKDLGCSIALDDFGSGMSSLTYLKNLPIDYLKIDGSFVTNIAQDKVDYATVECFNHISQIMSIKTIAEFVENKAILQHLQKIGINYAQGYGIERPKPLIWSC
ncbi:MAG: EAL domain-containing protein, partial [Cyanobacteria bacterium J06629_2]